MPSIGGVCGLPVTYRRDGSTNMEGDNIDHVYINWQDFSDCELKMYFKWAKEVCWLDSWGKTSKFSAVELAARYASRCDKFGICGSGFS